MSTWSTPYIKVTDLDGQAVDWCLPDTLPFPAGAATQAALRDCVDAVALGLPAGELVVRWRTPTLRNPRRRTFATDDPQGLALLCDLQRVHDAGGQGWTSTDDGWPLPAAPSTAAAAAQLFTADRGAASQPIRTAPSAPFALDPSARTRARADNPILVAVRNGELSLGATVDDVIEAVLQDSWAGWKAKERGNKLSVYRMVSRALRYEEPKADDTPEVAEWKRARLALDGVEEGCSMHVMLLLGPDLRDAVNLRRYTDRRIDQLNDWAAARFTREYDRWLHTATAKKNGTWRGGHTPPKPVWLERDETEIEVKARTEQLFAQCLGKVLRHAANNGMLVGPNPWQAFAETTGASSGYRRPQPMQFHERNVAPIGKIIELADTIATMGPIDRRCGLPQGDRYRALVLASVCGARPSELVALAPPDFDYVRRTLTISKSAVTVNKEFNDGSDWHVSPTTKQRRAGTFRTVELPTFVADAIQAHIEAGYASDSLLFTSVEGGPVRLGNIRDTIWRPAVEKVFGYSGEPVLRELEFRWLRKSAITWMLRAGKTIPQVADIAGHSPVVLLNHYAGVTQGSAARIGDSGSQAASAT